MYHFHLSTILDAGNSSCVPVDVAARFERYAGGRLTLPTTQAMTAEMTQMTGKHLDAQPNGTLHGHGYVCSTESVRGSTKGAPDEPDHLQEYLVLTVG